MAYRFKPGKLTGKAVRRIAREQTDRAIAALAKDDVQPDDIHEARKVVKRLRSLLKLVEPSLSGDDFDKLYRNLGRTGRMLAGARDRHVLEMTIAKLEERFGSPAKDALAPLRAGLPKSAGNGRADVDSETLASAKAAFVKEANRLDKLKLSGRGLGVFAEGLEDTYKKARKNFESAYARPHDERFHEMRKAVQWHWRHMALLSRAWPDYFAVRVSACQELSEALGDDHDLSVLAAAAATLDENAASHKADVEQFVQLRQDELRCGAHDLAERLFAEAPRAFRRRMEAYWRAGVPHGLHGSVPPDTKV